MGSDHRECEATTLPALMYRLERRLRPFESDEVKKLPTDRWGVYALWLPSGGENAARVPVRRHLDDVHQEAAARSPFPRDRTRGFAQS